MPNCGANKCTNRSTEYPENSFHRLPNDEKKKELRKAWLLKINRKHIPKEMYICSDHFESDCFERDYKVKELLIFTYQINIMCFPM